MGLPKILSTTALYETQQLSFSNLKVEFVVNRTSNRDSRDIKVKAARIQARAGRRWGTPRELQVAEEKLRQKALVGTIAKRKASLGSFPTLQLNKA